MNDLVTQLGTYASTTLKLNNDLVEYVLRNKLPEMPDRNNCASCSNCNHCNVIQQQLDDEFSFKKSDLVHLDEEQYPILNDSVNQHIANTAQNLFSKYFNIGNSTKTSGKMPNGFYQTLAGVLCYLFPQLQTSGATVGHMNMKNKLSNKKRNRSRHVRCNRNAAGNIQRVINVGGRRRIQISRADPVQAGFEIEDMSIEHW